MVIPRILARSCLVINKSIYNQISCRQTTHKLIHTTSYNLADRFYTEKHEWVEVNGKIGTVGISQYAQEALGDVVYAQLPEVGAVLNKEDECGALESVKAASEIYCPVSGKVTEKNNNVEETPSLINSSCYDKGWLFKIELNSETDVKELMNENKYKEFLKSDAHH